MISRGKKYLSFDGFTQISESQIYVLVHNPAALDDEELAGYKVTVGAG